MAIEFESVRDYLLAQKESTEGVPFGPDLLVYKVGGKMFAILSPTDNPLRMNLKCDPDFSEMLRDQYQAIIPGYHMNKRHWNTLTLDDSLEEAMVLDLIDHSYELIVKSLKKADRQRLLETK